MRQAWQIEVLGSRVLGRNGNGDLVDRAYDPDKDKRLVSGGRGGYKPPYKDPDDFVLFTKKQILRNKRAAVALAARVAMPQGCTYVPRGTVLLARLDLLNYDWLVAGLKDMPLDRDMLVPIDATSQYSAQRFQTLIRTSVRRSFGAGVFEVRIAYDRKNLVISRTTRQRKGEK